MAASEYCQFSYEETVGKSKPSNFANFPLRRRALTPSDDGNVGLQVVSRPTRMSELSDLLGIPYGDEEVNHGIEVIFTVSIAVL